MRESLWTPSVSMGPATSTEALEEIANSYSHPQILLRIAIHPNVSEELLLKLSQNPHEEVSRKAIARLADFEKQ